MGRWMPITTTVGCCAGITIALFPAAAAARSCRATTPAIASPELQQFDVEAFGLTLEIPSNYRSMLRSSGHITFHDPNSFSFIQCLARTGEYGQVPPYVVLEVHPAVDRTRPLVELIRERRPWLDYYSPEYIDFEFGGQAAVRYTYFNEIYRLEITNVTFLAEDGRTLLTLAGPAEHPIMVNVLNMPATNLSDLQIQ